MPQMLRELAEADRGLLGARSFFGGRTLLTIQYWRSAEELGAYGRDASMSHAPAWGGVRQTCGRHRRRRLKTTEPDYVDAPA